MYRFDEVNRAAAAEIEPIGMKQQNGLCPFKGLIAIAKILAATFL